MDSRAIAEGNCKWDLGGFNFDHRENRISDVWKKKIGQNAVSLL